MRRLAAILVVTLAGCVDNFGGSKVQMFLRGGVHVPGDDPAGFGRPPSDTHYEIFLVKDGFTFEVFAFEVKPVLDRADPCFIDLEESRYPGIHATKYAERLEADLTAGGHIPDENEAGDIYLAQKRLSDMPVLARDVRAIVEYGGLTNAEIAALYAAADLPDVTETGDEANAERLATCNAIFEAHPLLYVGSDKVFSLPISGNFLGVVDGTDPRNGAFIAGSAFNVDVVMSDFDSLLINWLFNDEGDPRRAGYQPSAIGWHYMSGVPVERTRGVINVSLINNEFSDIDGEIAIFANLQSDDVNF